MTDVTPEVPTSSLEGLLQYVGDETEDPFKFAFYGASGVGKTTLAASAPSPLILDLDFGTSSLRKNPGFHGIPYIKIKNMGMVSQVISALRSGEMPDRKTVVIDNTGELQKQQLTIRLKRQAQIDKARDPFISTWPDYNANTELMRRMLIAFRDLDRNIIFTCHPDWEKDALGNMFWAPSVTPKFRESFVALMDVVGYMTIPDPKEGDDPNLLTRILQVHPTKTVIAKCRYDLPRFLENPTINDILKGR